MDCHPTLKVTLIIDCHPTLKVKNKRHQLFERKNKIIIKITLIIGCHPTLKVKNKLKENKDKKM